MLSFQDPGPKFITQTGLLITSVCSFLQLLLFLIMEKDAMKYLTRKAKEFKEKGSIQRNTLKKFEKRQRKMKIKKNANVNDIFVIELE